MAYEILPATDGVTPYNATRDQYIQTGIAGAHTLGASAATLGASALALASSAYSLGASATRPNLVTEFHATTPYYICAHRGSGDHMVEHTAEAYDLGLSMGFPAVEVSAQPTADGVVICMHDLTLDRTTSASGNVQDTAWSQLQGQIVDYGATQFGAGHTATYRVPALGPVLARWQHRGVVYLEAKADGHAVLDVVERFPESGKWIVWKFFRPDNGVLPTHATRARALGLHLWIYVNDDDTDELIQTTAGIADSLGIELTASDAKIAVAVATGKPVMVHPVRRRSERDRLVALDVAGIMSTAPAYVGNDEPRMTTWAGLRAGARMPGDYWASESRQGTFNPADSSLTLGQGSNGGIVLGSLCPPASGAGGYRVRFDLKWPTLPVDSNSHSDLYLCHASDAPYINQTTTNVDGGYHLFPRVNGTIAIFRHDPGVSSGTSLATATASAAVADTWMSFEADVTPTQIIFRRTDVSPTVTASAANTQYRGGYLGFSAATTSVAPVLRNVSVASLP